MQSTLTTGPKFRDHLYLPLKKSRAASKKSQSAIRFLVILKRGFPRFDCCSIMVSDKMVSTQTLYPFINIGFTNFESKGLFWGSAYYG